MRPSLQATSSAPGRPLLALALALATSLCVSACSPLPLLQDARIVENKGAGFAVAMTLPTRKGTYLEADGEGTDNTDLYLRPLPHALGWYRHGMSRRIEIQSTVHIPTFSLAVGTKVGLIGPDPGSPFALSISGEAGGSPVLGHVVLGASIHMSVRTSAKTSLDSTTRFGTYPGLWDEGGLLSVLGVSIETPRRTWRVGAGYAFDVGFDSAPAAYLAIGFEE